MEREDLVSPAGHLHPPQRLLEREAGAETILHQEEEMPSFDAFEEKDPGDYEAFFANPQTRPQYLDHHPVLEKEVCALAADAVLQVAPAVAEQLLLPQHWPLPDLLPAKSDPNHLPLP